MLSPIPLQRLEGLALLGAGLLTYALSGPSWWLFVGLLLVPDVSMVGYAAGPSVGAAFYNLGHTVVWPALLLGWGILSGLPLAAGLGAVWLAHIGMDRALGYGLKFATGFPDTHLGRIGRPRSSGGPKGRE